MVMVCWVEAVWRWRYGYLHFFPVLNASVKLDKQLLYPNLEMSLWFSQISVVDMLMISISDSIFNNHLINFKLFLNVNPNFLNHLTTLFVNVCPYNHIFNQHVYQRTFYFVIENMSNDQSISLMALVFIIKSHKSSKIV